MGNLEPDPLQHQVVYTVNDLWVQDAPIMEQHGLWFKSNVATSNHIYQVSGTTHQCIDMPQQQGVSKINYKLLDTNMAAQNLSSTGYNAHNGHHYDTKSNCGHNPQHKLSTHTPYKNMWG